MDGKISLRASRLFDGLGSASRGSAWVSLRHTLVMRGMVDSALARAQKAGASEMLDAIDVYRQRAWRSAAQIPMLVPSSSGSESAPQGEQKLSDGPTSTDATPATDIFSGCGARFAADIERRAPHLFAARGSSCACPPPPPARTAPAVAPAAPDVVPTVARAAPPLARSAPPPAAQPRAPARSNLFSSARSERGRERVPEREQKRKRGSGSGGGGGGGRRRVEAPPRAKGGGYAADANPFRRGNGQRVVDDNDSGSDLEGRASDLRSSRSTRRGFVPPARAGERRGAAPSRGEARRGAGGRRRYGMENAAEAERVATKAVFGGGKSSGGSKKVSLLYVPLHAVRSC